MKNIHFILNDAPIETITIALKTDTLQKVLYIHTQLHVNPEMWDVRKQCPKNIYEKNCKKINETLNKLRIAISEYLDYSHQKNKKIKSEVLQKQVNKIIAGDDIKHTEKDLLYYADRYIKSRHYIISASTQKRYTVFFNLLKRYEGHKAKKVSLEEVDGGFVKEFLEFGKTERYSTSTLYRTVHFVRTILNYIEKRGIQTKKYDLELPKHQNISDVVMLSEKELKKIQKIELPEELRSARDWLLISCYTGQRISDFMLFTKDTIVDVYSRQCLSFTQKKTGKDILLPLHPIVVSITSKYPDGFPKKISINKYNRQIREIAKMAGVNEIVQVNKRDGFRSCVTTVPKWQAISSHIGRRSFASNFYGKIPTPLLMDVTGHHSENMFRRYVHKVDTNRVRILAEYFDEKRSSTRYKR